MKTINRALLLLPMLNIITIGAMLALHDMLHWSWYVLALGWLGVIILAELPIPPDNTTDPPANHR